MNRSNKGKQPPNFGLQSVVGVGIPIFLIALVVFGMRLLDKTGNLIFITSVVFVLLGYVIFIGWLTRYSEIRRWEFYNVREYHSFCSDNR